MPDWNKLIRERLGHMNLPGHIQDEVVNELATHLHEVYKEKVSEGNSESNALEAALGQVPHWHPLAKQIQRAKSKQGIVNSRSKQFWLPALLSLTASMVWLMLIQVVAEKIHLPWRYSNIAYIPYVMWIVTLPLIGALSGHFSNRAGSTRSVCFSAVIFPCTVMFVLWLVLVAYLFIRQTPNTIHALSIGYGLLSWVVFPAIALLAGAWLLAKRQAVVE